MDYIFCARPDMFNVGDAVRFKTVEELKKSFSIDEIETIISVDDFRKFHESETFIVKSVRSSYFTAYGYHKIFNLNYFTLVENIQSITSNEVEELLEVLL